MSAQEIVWFTLAVLLVIGELMTGTFYLLMVAIGLLAGGLAAWPGWGSRCRPSWPRWLP